MHRKVAVSTLIYNHLYPRPTAHDPPNFTAYLNRYLVPEIRVETARFYGSLDTIEARYPGLNYSFPPHVRRLASFPHHQRLFRAIARLQITDTEVLDLAKWEGTLWARERFEKDEGYKVSDTTGDDIGPWVDRRKTIRIAAVTAAKCTAETTTHSVGDLPVAQIATACEGESHEPDGPIDVACESGEAGVLEEEAEVLEEEAEVLEEEVEVLEGQVHVLPPPPHLPPLESRPAWSTAPALAMREQDAVLGVEAPPAFQDSSTPVSASTSNSALASRHAVDGSLILPSPSSVALPFRMALDRYLLHPSNRRLAQHTRHELEVLVDTLACAQERDVAIAVFRRIIMGRLSGIDRQTLPSATTLIRAIQLYLDRRLQLGTAVRRVLDMVRTGRTTVSAAAAEVADDLVTTSSATLASATLAAAPFGELAISQPAAAA